MKRYLQVTSALWGFSTALLGIYEIWALLTHHTPITGYVRAAELASPVLGYAVCGILGWLCGHFGRV